MPYQIKIAREDMLSYIQATLMGGMKKAVAYKAFIDPLIGHVYPAINRLENRDDFHELMQNIIDTDDLAAKKSISRVRNKYLTMTEKALDKASELLDESGEEGKSSADKAQAVRLANETFGAMAIIGASSPNTGNSQGAIDKKSHII